MYYLVILWISLVCGMSPFSISNFVSFFLKKKRSFFLNHSKNTTRFSRANLTKDAHNFHRENNKMLLKDIKWNWENVEKWNRSTFKKIQYCNDSDNLSQTNLWIWQNVNWHPNQTFLEFDPQLMWSHSLQP
jgi:hypothetical protein